MVRIIANSHTIISGRDTGGESAVCPRGYTGLADGATRDSVEIPTAFVLICVVKRTQVLRRNSVERVGLAVTQTEAGTRGRFQIESVVDEGVSIGYQARCACICAELWVYSTAKLADEQA